MGVILGACVGVILGACAGVIPDQAIHLEQTVTPNKRI